MYMLEIKNNITFSLLLCGRHLCDAQLGFLSPKLSNLELATHSPLCQVNIPGPSPLCSQLNTSGNRLAICKEYLAAGREGNMTSHTITLTTSTGLCAHSTHPNTSHTNTSTNNRSVHGCGWVGVGGRGEGDHSGEGKAAKIQGYFCLTSPSNSYIWFMVILS